MSIQSVPAFLLLVLTIFVEKGYSADIDFALICDKGYRVSSIKRAKTAYSLLGSLTVECEQIALGESTNCAPQQSVPKCTGLLEGCTGNTWLGGFHVYLLENTTQAAVLDPVCCSSPSVQIDSGSCINDQLNTGTHDFSHSIVADLVYRGWQCWHQYDRKRTLVDLLWKTEICPFSSSDFPVITRKTECEECSCECGIEQCSNGASPVRVIHKKLLLPCACDCCTGNTWLGGFHVYLLENTTQAAVLDPVCCSSPSVQIDSGSCINDQLNTGTHDFSHSIVADLVYRGWQCWHQYDRKRTLVDLLWKTEICPFSSSDFPVITRKTECEECSCECGIEQCSNGASPVRVIHKKLLLPCACDCTCTFKCL